MDPTRRADMDPCCDTPIDVANLQARQRRVLAWVFGINVATFAIMVTGSVMSGSSALLSGTLDNFGDALTFALSMAVVGASARAKARVAMLKGLLILGAAIAVAAQIAWRMTELDVPVASTMSIAAVLNLVANAVCLKLLTPYRYGDVNMSSSWECSRNDVIEGVAVIATAAAVWVFASPWPDLVVAVVLLAVFLRSASRVLRNAWRELALTTA
ncbi:MAG: cation transporter [Gammaproteobacteria bacterium]|nr:cation transporter [Gammaproteobacteria bacterium]